MKPLGFPCWVCMPVVADVNTLWLIPDDYHEGVIRPPNYPQGFDDKSSIMVLHLRLELGLVNLT